MFKIYQKAQRVLVRLGEEGPYTGEALQYLRAHSMLNLDYRADRYKPNSSELVSSPDEWIGLPTPELREAIVDLCFRPWSRRVWVRQEVYAARDIVVCCGVHTMTFDEFKSLLERIQAIRQAFSGSETRSRTEKEWDQDWSAMSDLQTYADIKLAELKMGRRMWNDPNRRPSSNRGIHGRIEEILTRLNNLEASDPRDLVYGLLKLTSCPMISTSDPDIVGHLALRIDYSKTLSETNSSCQLWTVDWRRNARSVKWAQLGAYHAAKTWEWQQPNVEGTIAVHGNRIAVVCSAGIHPAGVEWASAFSISFEAFSHITCCKDGSKYVLQWTQQPDLTSYGRHIGALGETDWEEQYYRAHSNGQLISLQAGDVLVYMDGLFDCLVYLRPVNRSHNYKLVCIVNLGAHLELLVGSTPTPGNTWFGWFGIDIYTVRDSYTGTSYPLEDEMSGSAVEDELRDLLSAHAESLERFLVC
ncbi:hypothetical protein LTR17_011126 [Elasticomyces elasticus]|nr:hypothetical protein LTR17_011126 [Elasticomyces elasticus]